MKYDLSQEADKKMAISYFKKLLDSGARIELKKFHSQRTLRQNNYFHAACKMLSDYSGYTIDETKIIIKEQLEFMTYEKGGHRFYRSSADLDKIEFADLVDFTRDFGDQHGCYIPTSDEYMESQFEIEKQYNI